MRSGRPAHGTRPGQRQRHDVVSATASATTGPAVATPAGVITTRDLTVRDCAVDAEPTMAVRCVVGAMTRLPSRHRCCVLPAIASATMGSAAAPGRCRHLPTMMVRCVVGAVARALTPPSPAPTFRLRDMAAFRLSKHGGALASATRGSAANPDGAVDPRRSVLPSLTALARAVIAFGYTTARGRVNYNQKSSIRPYFP
jgi:hypothetical protein